MDDSSLHSDDKENFAPESTSTETVVYPKLPDVCDRSLSPCSKRWRQLDEECSRQKIPLPLHRLPKYVARRRKRVDRERRAALKSANVEKLGETPSVLASRPQPPIEDSVTAGHKFADRSRVRNPNIKLKRRPILLADESSSSPLTDEEELENRLGLSPASAVERPDRDRADLAGQPFERALRLGDEVRNRSVKQKNDNPKPTPGASVSPSKRPQAALNADSSDEWTGDEEFLPRDSRRGRTLEHCLSNLCRSPPPPPTTSPQTPRKQAIPARANSGEPLQTPRSSRAERCATATVRARARRGPTSPSPSKKRG